MCFLAVKNDEDGNRKKFQAYVIRALAIAENSDEYEDIENGITRVAEIISKRTAMDEVGQLANALELAENRVTLLERIADFWVDGGKTDQARNLSFYVAEEVENIFEDIPHSWASSSLSCLLARLHEYTSAKEIADSCKLSVSKLAAYTAIFREYHIERDPVVGR